MGDYSSKAILIPPASVSLSGKTERLAFKFLESSNYKLYLRYLDLCLSRNMQKLNQLLALYVSVDKRK